MENSTTIRLFDHSNKHYVEIRRTDNGWERWVSKTRIKWEKVSVCKTMDSALMYKEEVVNNNFRHLYNLIRTKK